MAKNQINFSSKEAKEQLSEIVKHFDLNPTSYATKAILRATGKEEVSKLTQKDVLEFVVNDFYKRMESAEKALNNQRDNEVNNQRVKEKEERIKEYKKEVKALCQLQSQVEERFLFYINESFVKSQICEGQMRYAKEVFKDPSINKLVEQSNIKAGLEDEVARDKDPKKRASYNLKFRHYPNKNENGVLDFVEKGLSKILK